MQVNILFKFGTDEEVNEVTQRIGRNSRQVNVNIFKSNTTLKRRKEDSSDLINLEVIQSLQSNSDSSGSSCNDLMEFGTPLFNFALPADNSPILSAVSAALKENLISLSASAWSLYDNPLADEFDGDLVFTYNHSQLVNGVLILKWYYLVLSDLDW